MMNGSKTKNPIRTPSKLRGNNYSFPNNNNCNQIIPIPNLSSKV